MSSEITTITVEKPTKEQFDKFADMFHSNNEALDTLMKIIPDEWECINCGREFAGTSISNGGVITYFAPESFMTDVVSLFACTTTCAEEKQAEWRSYVPEHPDKVTLGGDNMLEVTLENATFYIDGSTAEAGIDVPTAFDGYEGEPAIIEHDGRVIHEFIIDEIIHEDAYTGFIFY